jgi:hypothetical protein
MKSKRSRAIRWSGLFWAGMVMMINAEDWTTRDGKTYAQVTVVKTEADAVTILYRDGGALVPLANLPADLQQRFHYDPAKASAAADERAREDAASAVALQAESAQFKEQQKEMLAKQAAADKAKKQREMLARIHSYNDEPAVLEPQNHPDGILDKPK